MAVPQALPAWTQKSDVVHSDAMPSARHGGSHDDVTVDRPRHGTETAVVGAIAVATVMVVVS